MVLAARCSSLNERVRGQVRGARIGCAVWCSSLPRYFSGGAGQAGVRRSGSSSRPLCLFGSEVGISTFGLAHACTQREVGCFVQGHVRHVLRAADHTALCVVAGESTT